MSKHVDERGKLSLSFDVLLLVGLDHAKRIVIVFGLDRAANCRRQNPRRRYAIIFRTIHNGIQHGVQGFWSGLAAPLSPGLGGLLRPWIEIPQPFQRVVEGVDLAGDVRLASVL